MHNEELQINLAEQLGIGIFTGIVGILTAWDLAGDSKTGSSFMHLILEGLVVVTSLLFLARTFYFLYKKNKRINKDLLASQKEALQLRLDNQNYREDSRRFLAGVSVLIDKQFTDWKLTHSESEVALLILKGLSLKEISAIRETSEKTVRHQAGVVYAKANLEGRAQLSAFFLEDLFLPQT